MRTALWRKYRARVDRTARWGSRAASAALVRLHPGEALRRHRAGHVLAREAAHLEVVQVGALEDGVPHVLDLLVDEVVGADLARDLGDPPAVGYELAAARHVDPVDVRVPHRG